MPKNKDINIESDVEADVISTNPPSTARTSKRLRTKRKQDTSDTSFSSSSTTIKKAKRSKTSKSGSKLKAEPSRKPKVKPIQASIEEEIDWSKVPMMPGPKENTHEDTLASWEELIKYEKTSAKQKLNIQAAMTDLKAGKKVGMFYQNEKACNNMEDLVVDPDQPTFVAFMSNASVNVATSTMYEAINSKCHKDDGDQEKKDRRATSSHYINMGIRAATKYIRLLPNPSTIRLKALFDTGCNVQTLRRGDIASLGFTSFYLSLFEHIQISSATGTKIVPIFPVECCVLTNDANGVPCDILKTWYSDWAVLLNQPRDKTCTGFATKSEFYWALVPGKVKQKLVCGVRKSHCVAGMPAV